MASSKKLGCTHPKVERRSRAGLVDALMYRFGKYPWTCRLCGCRLYFKDRRPGHGKVRQESTLVVSRAAIREEQR